MQFKKATIQETDKESATRRLREIEKQEKELRLKKWEILRGLSTRENYPDKNLIEHVHLSVIDGEDLQESLQEWLDNEGKDGEWYNDIKYYPQNYSIVIVHRHRNKRGYRELVEKGNLDTKSLKSSPHTQAHLNALGKSQRLKNYVTKLEDRVDVNTSDIHKLKKELEIEDYSPKAHAKVLYDEGLGVTDICKTLNIGRTTFYRWKGNNFS